MSLLRILRNLAVLVILTVGVLSLIPRPAAAQSSCLPIGSFCNQRNQCCDRLCGPYHRCCLPFKGALCTSNAQCCSYNCFFHFCH